MTERLIILPPEYKETPQPVIFLAGPIQGAADWQSEAIDIINQLNPDIIVASPRRSAFCESLNFDEQVDWETHFLDRAGKNGVVLFWLAREQESMPGRAYAQTTRAELFEWKEKHLTRGAKLALGIEEGFTGSRYIRRRFGQECPEITICTSLEETCRSALAQIS